MIPLFHFSQVFITIVQSVARLSQKPELLYLTKVNLRTITEKIVNNTAY